MMLFLEAVLDKTRQIEGLLVDKLGASGRGLHEKMLSVKGKLDDTSIKRIRYIATIRNKLVHEPGFTFDGDEREFLDRCDQVVSTLNSIKGARLKRPAARIFGSTTPINQSATPASQPAESDEWVWQRKKPWYRSTLLLWILFFLLPPLWAVFILFDRNRGWLMKLVASGMLIASAYLAYNYYLFSTFLFDFSPVTKTVGEPLLSPVPALPQEGNLQTAGPASSSASSEQADSCEVVWVAYQDDSLANKNRSMVWTEFVEIQVVGSGMTARQFFDEVVERNPSLKADGYVFMAEKSYYLPHCK